MIAKPRGPPVRTNNAAVPGCFPTCLFGHTSCAWWLQRSVGGGRPHVDVTASHGSRVGGAPDGSVSHGNVNVLPQPRRRIDGAHVGGSATLMMRRATRITRHTGPSFGAMSGSFGPSSGGGLVSPMRGSVPVTSGSGALPSRTAKQPGRAQRQRLEAQRARSQQRARMPAGAQLPVARSGRGSHAVHRVRKARVRSRPASSGSSFGGHHDRFGPVSMLGGAGRTSGGPIPTNATSASNPLASSRFQTMPHRPRR